MLTTEEKLAIARAPITRGILATDYHTHAAGCAHAGHGERPSTPIYNERGRRVGSRAMCIGDGGGE